MHTELPRSTDLLRHISSEDSESSSEWQDLIPSFATLNLIQGLAFCCSVLAYLTFLIAEPNIFPRFRQCAPADSPRHAQARDSESSPEWQI